MTTRMSVTTKMSDAAFEVLVAVGVDVITQMSVITASTSGVNSV